MTLQIDTYLLRQLRAQAALTERALARTAQTSPLRIRRLEAGVAHPQVTLGLLDRLAAALNTDPRALLVTHPPSRPPQSPPHPQPRRPLTLTDARILRAASEGNLRLSGRGPTHLATSFLLAQGLLTLERPTLTARAAVRVIGPLAERLPPEPQPNPSPPYPNRSGSSNTATPAPPADPPDAR